MFSTMKLIEWIEERPDRARRYALMTTIRIWLFITVTALLLTTCNVDISNFSTFYYSLSTVAGTAIAFYTGFKAKSINNSEEKQK